MDAKHHTTYKDYYKVLEVDYDATDEKIRLNYRKLALKWHPDKHKGDSAVTAKFQEINEAYTVLSDPDKRLEYDLNGNYEIDKYTLREYLSRFKGMILTCNGLGISHSSIWSQTLMELNDLKENEVWSQHISPRQYFSLSTIHKLVKYLYHIAACKVVDET